MRIQEAELHNCYDITEDAYDGTTKLIRVPEWVRCKMGQIGSRFTAYNTPNMEVRFCMESEAVTVSFRIHHPEGGSYGSQALEVYFGCFQDDNLRILDDAHCEITIKKPENMELLKKLTKENHLPFSPEVVRIIAPGDCHLMIEHIEGSIRTPKRWQTPKLRWLAYGSSITQGSNGLHPGGTYAAIAARRLGVDLINFGFGGSALLEPEMADFIADRNDFDFLTLEMGVNMTWDIENNCQGDPELFRRRVDYFVTRIADAHRDKWIFCLDIFRNKDDYTINGLTECYRAVVKEKVEKLGRDRVIYLDGLQFLKSPDSLCTDLLHPSSKGCAEIGNKLAETIASYMKL